MTANASAASPRSIAHPAFPSPSVPAARPPTERSGISPVLLQRAAFWLPLAATCYSAMLAMMIARGFPGSMGLVILIELALLGCCLIVCAKSGLKAEDWPALLLIYAFLVAAVVVTMIGGRPMLETLRSSAIIGIFVMVGQRMTYRTLDRLFAWVFVLVLAGLMLEMVSLSSYAAVFAPAKFYEATRGIATAEYNNTGLFNTATSYEGRFSFGLFSGPRTSSIFLEQISNANFACIGALYLAVRGRALPKWLLLVELGTVALILLTSNSRFGTLLVALTLVGYAIYPLLPRVALPLGSLAIAAGALIVIMHNINAQGDDLQARLAFVGRKFRDADVGFYFGLHADQAAGERDSGYSFVIGTTTIFGMMILWLFVNLVPRMDDPPARRLGWGLVSR